MFKGKHTFVCGMTQSGKTTFVMNQLKKSKCPVFFFNPQRVDLGSEYIRVNIKTAIWQHVLRALRRGEKIDFVPQLEDATASKELEFLVNRLFEAGFTKDKPVIVAIDEAHMVSDYKEGKRALRKVANRGLTYGVHAVFISQRPANVEYTILTQSDQHVIFKTGYEREYFTRKGLDYAEIKNKIQAKGDHAYVVWNGYELSGAYRENL